MQRENHGNGGRYERQHDDGELAWGVEPQQAVVVRPDLDEPREHLGGDDPAGKGVRNDDHAAVRLPRRPTRPLGMQPHDKS